MTVRWVHYGHDSDARFLGDVNIERRGSSCLTISFLSETLPQWPRITGLCPTTMAAEIMTTRWLDGGRVLVLRAVHVCDGSVPDVLAATVLTAEDDSSSMRTFV